MAAAKNPATDRIDHALAGKLVSDLAKKHGSALIRRASAFGTEPVPRLPTGVFMLDYGLGGGFPAGRVNIVYGHKSCVAGSTFVPYQVRLPGGRLANHKGGSIERLWERFHGQPAKKGEGKGKYLCPETVGAEFWTLSLNEDDLFFENKIEDVVRTGRKECFRVETLGGFSSVVTADHRFFTGTAYVRLGELAPGDTVFVHTKTRAPRKVKDFSYRAYVYPKHHPVAGKKDVRSRVSRTEELFETYTYHRLARYRAVVEAAMNGLSFDTYMERLNTGALEGLIFLAREDHVHHKDEDYTNDALDNLQVLKASEHEALHAIDRHNNLRFAPTLDVICSVVSVGAQETYDICMTSPFNNYVADGFVTHNSGKTTVLLKMIANAQKMCADCWQFVFDGKCGCKRVKKPVISYIDVEGCIAEDQEILDPWTGFVGSVSDFMQKEEARRTISWNDGALSLVEVPVRVNSGVQATVVLRTKTTSLRCTPNHPVLTWRSGPVWVQASHIRCGERIARPWKVTFEGVNTGVSSDDAELLGMLVGDGAFDPGGSLVFTNVDEAVWERLAVLIAPWACTLNRYDDRHGRLVGCSSYAEHRWGEGNKLRRWVSDLGLMGLTSENKRLPGEVLRAPISVVAGALAGLWMTDGSVHVSRPSLAFSTSSRVLAVQVRWMLARLGVLGRVSSHWDGDDNHKEMWIVTVNGRESLRKFAEKVCLYGRRFDLLAAWCESDAKRHKLSLEYLLPGYDNAKHYQEKEEWLNNSDVWWDEVTSNQEAEPIRCWDAGVPEGHSWTVSDVLVHNTWDAPWAKTHGVDLDDLILSVPEYAEQSLDLADGFIRSGDVDIVILDSIAFLVPSLEIETSLDKSIQMGSQPRLVGSGIRKIVSGLNAIGNDRGYDKRPTMFLTNQVRMKIGMIYGNPETQPGGMAPGFAASTETKFWSGKYEMDETTNKPLYVNLNFKVEKNKTSAAKIEGEYKMLLADTETKRVGQILEEGHMVELGERMLMIEKVGGDYTCFGEKYAAKSHIERRLMTDTPYKLKYAKALMTVLQAA